MKKAIYVLLVFAFVGVTAQNRFDYSRDFKSIQQQSRQTKNALHYETLLARFERNDPTLTEPETLALLIGQTARQKYTPGADLFKEGIIYSLIDEAKYEDAVGLAGKYLKMNPVSLKANFAKSQAFRKLNEADSAAVYDKKWQKILKAMFYSGNGMRMETPVFSMGPEDAKEFIEFYIGAKPIANKEAKDNAGHILQVWEAILGKKKLTLYFITDHASVKMAEEQNR